MIYLVAAYAVIWLLTFVFVGSVLVRQQQLQRQLLSLETLVESRQAESGARDIAGAALAQSDDLG